MLDEPPSFAQSARRSPSPNKEQRPASLRARPRAASDVFGQLAERGARFALLSDGQRRRLAADLSGDAPSLRSPPRFGLSSLLAAVGFGAAEPDWTALLLKADTWRLEQTRETLFGVMDARGLPARFRAAFWRRMIGNRFRVSKALFNALLRTAVSRRSALSLKCRTFCALFDRFRRRENFSQLSIEAAILIQMFSLYRSDLETEPTAFYIAFLFLIHFPPLPAFKCLLNALLGYDFQYDQCRGKGARLSAVSAATMRLGAPRLSGARLPVDAWLRTGFVETLGLGAALIFWDFYLSKPNKTIARIAFCFARSLTENVEMAESLGFESVFRILALRNSDRILAEIAERESAADTICNAFAEN